MTAVLFVLGYVVMIFINLIIAKENSDQVNYNKRRNIPTQINHVLWGGIYSVPCIISWFCSGHSYWYVLALAAQHLAYFPIFYNYYQGLPMFNLSKTSASIIDRFQVSLGFKSSEIVNIGSLLVSIAALILAIHKSI